MLTFSCTLKIKLLTTLQYSAVEQSTVADMAIAANLRETNTFKKSMWLLSLGHVASGTLFATLESSLHHHKQHHHHICGKCRKEIDRGVFLMGITSSQVSLLLPVLSQVSIATDKDQGPSNLGEIWVIMIIISFRQIECLKQMFEWCLCTWLLFYFCSYPKGLFAISSKVYSWINLNCLDLDTV